MDASTPNPVLCQISDTLAEDIAAVCGACSQFAAGEISAADLKHTCAPMGVYEERVSGIYMARARLAAGVILPHQMRALADLSARLGGGILHFTTRQSIQLHGVPREDLREVLVALQAAGLSTQATGGDAVRNVATCPDTGVCPHEVFEVAPHAVALTEFLLPDPISHKLPRKFKIAVSGCGRDCAGATVSDVGFVATRREGGRGFVVYAGGGLGARSAVAQLLEEFVPESDLLLVAEAMKRVFNEHGNRANRGRARLRFLVEERGFAAVEELYRQELAKLRETPPALPALRPLPQPSLSEQGEPGPSTSVPGPGFEAWLAANVAPQAQPERHLVSLRLPLGDIEARVFEQLAAVVAEFGEGVLVTTASQNALLRWVRTAALPALHGRLVELGLAGDGPAVLGEVVSCLGATTCRPGLLVSRGLAAAITAQLRASGLELSSLANLRIKISGCPNACGRHPVADIGLSGAVRRVDGRPVPHYAVGLGGVVQAGATKLARPAGVLPARSVPSFVTDLLKAFVASPQFPEFNAFAEAHEAEIGEMVAACTAVPTFEDDSSYYCEWGSDKPYSPRE